MCNTMNDSNVEACTYCGYIFEDFVTKNNQTQIPSSKFKREPQAEIPSVSAGIPTTEGSPVFVASTSLLSALVPLAFYIAIGFFAFSSGAGAISIALFAFIVVFAVIPLLNAPRKFEFYDDSLKIHRTLRGITVIPYSDITISEFSSGFRKSTRTYLSIKGRRRPIALPGNPTSKELGVDLKQWLTQKLQSNKTKESN